MTRREEPSLHQCFRQITFQYIPQCIRQFVQPVSELTRILNALCCQAQVASCSNAVAEYLLPMTQALEIDGWFDLIWPYRDGFRKPSAIPHILERLNAEKGIFVGDRLEDVSAAREADSAAVGIRNPVFPNETNDADSTVENHQQMQLIIEALLQEE